MPNGRRKGKSDRSKIEYDSDDEYGNVNDAASVVTSCSGYSEGSGEFGEESTVDLLEDRLLEMIDGLGEKSSKTRIDSFKGISKSLVKKYMPGFVKDRLFTLSDGIERSLKKGGGQERAAAADLVTQLCIQLGQFEDCEEISRQFIPVLLTIVNDKSVDADVRAKCCHALGNVAFLGGGEMGDVLDLMQQLETTFAGSYLKGDGTVPNLTPATANLHAAALSAWSLLLTLIAPDSVVHMMTVSKVLAAPYQIADLLESGHLDVRMAAGEALALIYELGRSEDEDFEDDFAGEVAATLKQLATDSNKFRAKKDRKQQRASFRDILQFIEENGFSSVAVKFGREELVLDSWSKRKQYEELCRILGPGINVHLTENDLLRDVLEISGAPPSGDGSLTHAQSQLERKRKKIQNAANFKARTISRGKNRDKRCDF